MKHFYLLVFGMLCCQLSWGQVGGAISISVNFQQATIEQVVTTLESKTPYHFYYDKAIFDSLRVTYQADQQTLPQVLDASFKSTNFHYTITNQLEVFLTKGRAMQTALPDGFFGQKVKPGQASVTAQNFATDEKEKSITEATIENKVYEIGIKSNNMAAGNATIAGYVKDAKTGEPITGASLYIPDIKGGANTDQFGFFSITMPKGSTASTSGQLAAGIPAARLYYTATVN